MKVHKALDSVWSICRETRQNVSNLILTRNWNKVDCKRCLSAMDRRRLTKSELDFISQYHSEFNKQIKRGRIPKWSKEVGAYDFVVFDGPQHTPPTDGAKP